MHAQGAPSILVSAAETYNFVPQFSPDGRKTVSPDGSSLVYSQWDRYELDILVMNNFR